jgi:hypothetical protein
MLNFEEFKNKLTSIEKGPDWLHAYVDKTGSYWIRAYGGMGTTIFKKLAPEHPFVDYIETLLKDNYLRKQLFHYEYESGEELAGLRPHNKND